MNLLLKASCLILFLAAGVFQVQAEEASSDDLISRVKALTAGEFAGRGSGTSEGYAAAQMLVSWFSKSGLKPAFGEDYYQTFPLRGKGWTGNDLTGKNSQNVGAIFPGSGILADRYIVVGAHHDHLGRLDVSLDDSGPAEPETFYAGANDNASGVSVLFEMVKILKNDDNKSRRSILFVCFGGEEVGLQGSGYFVSHSPVELSQIDAMINFDTVGQMSDNRLFVSGVATTEVFSSMVKTANTEKLDLTLGKGGWSGSDHMSFNTHEIPVLFVFGGPYIQYNTVDDLWSTLNVTGLKKIAQYSHRLIKDISIYPDELPWVMIADKLRPDHGSEQNKNTWFGSLPDFTEEIKGYKLAGVFDGSPAKLAGLKKGDILVKMAGQEIIDLETFTNTLRSHEPGTLVEVSVIRGGNNLNFTVVLGDRKNR
ncbi:MAG: M28 family peptidase [bacterium]|nr:M28 family peptidase [bacterium]